MTRIVVIEYKNVKHSTLVSKLIIYPQDLSSTLASLIHYSLGLRVYGIYVPLLFTVFVLQSNVVIIMTLA